MTNKRFMRSAILIAVLAALGASRVALAVDEIEPNDPLSKTQQLVIGSDGTAGVNGAILNTSTHRDTDFYSFQAQQGDVVTIDIDGGMKSANTGVDTVIAIFGPVGTNSVNLPPLQQNDDAPLDPGSVSTADSRIDSFNVPATGTYVVGVTSFPAYFADSDNLTTGSLGTTSPAIGDVTGTYTLLISGVTPPVVTPPVVTPPVVTPSVQQISIEIRPGSRDVIVAYSMRRHDFDRDDHEFEALRGRFKVKGGIPVALLSSDTFNALEVDQSSLKFGSTGNEDSLVRCNRHGVDVNGDKRSDLICHFDFRKANFEPGDNEGIVTGKTNSGTAFEGRGWLKIATGKRHHHHD